MGKSRSLHSAGFAARGNAPVEMTGYFEIEPLPSFGRGFIFLWSRPPEVTPAAVIFKHKNMSLTGKWKLLLKPFSIPEVTISA